MVTTDVTWDDLTEGTAAEPRDFGPLTRTDFVRYQGASGDFNPIHHDEEYAKSAGFPTVFSVGMLQAGILATYVTDWLGAANVRRYGEVPRTGLARRHAPCTGTVTKLPRTVASAWSTSSSCAADRQHAIKGWAVRRAVKARVLERAAPVGGAAPARRSGGTEPAAASEFTCACCRTDLHVVTGELDLPKLPVVPGHQVVRTVVPSASSTPARRGAGRRVLVALGRRCLPVLPAVRRTCASAARSPAGRTVGTPRRSPCPRTSRSISPRARHLAASPLLYLSGWLPRYPRRDRAGERALMGFPPPTWSCSCCATGAARSSCSLGARVRALAARRNGRRRRRAAAETCDRAVVFAPVGELVPVALRAIRPGGTVSLAGIHMSPLPVMDYALLWRERSLRSVANVTRRDAEEFVALAVEANVRAEYATYPLDAANDALAAIAGDSVQGTAILQIA